MCRSIITSIVLCVLSISTASTLVAQSQPSDPQVIRAELDRLRREFETLRQEYGDRFSLLEARLSSLEGTTPQPATSLPQIPEPLAQGLVPVPPGSAGADGPQGSLPVYGNPSVMSKIFNPDIAVIGNFIGAAGTNPVEPLPAFDLPEIETSLQAIVDPYARADVFFAVSPEGIDVEEGYITFPTLPGGLLMKAGKLRSSFGRVNQMHTHLLPWTDRPLVTENLLGGDEGIADAGVSIARLLPNPWIFLEATGEVYRGESAVFQSYQRQDLTYVAHLRGYGDLSESSNVDVGASFAYGHNDADPSATTQIMGLDATFRYRPLRRAIYRRLLARSELVWSRRSEAGDLTAFGAYLAGDYQFARRWFAGARYDYSARATDVDAKDKGISLVMTYGPSEFSQIRAQYRRTKYAEGVTANEALFQLLFSIGAHGAHAF
jgi:hypothetical protein